MPHFRLIKDFATLESFWTLRYQIGVFAFAFILYITTLNNDYTTDDIYVTAMDPVVRTGTAGLKTIFTTPYIQFEKFNFDYRPLPKASFALEAEFFGVNPKVSHFIQALIYGILCCSLFSILVAVFQNINRYIILFAVLFFTAHPIHTEVVAGLKSRDELLSFLFSMWSFYAFWLWWKFQRWFYILWVVLFFILAILSKQSSFILLLWIPLLLYFSSEKIQWPRLTVSMGLLALLPAAFFLIIPKIVAFSSADMSRTMQYVENPVGRGDYLAGIGLSLSSLWFYLTKMLFPHPLGWYYGFNMIPVQKPWELLPLFSLLVHIFLLFWALRNVKNRSPLSLGILLYLTAIAPFLTMVSSLPGIVGERFAFFASLGFSIGLSAIVFSLGKTLWHDIKARPRLPAIYYVVVILTLYSIKVVARNFDYRNNLTLYEKDIEYLDRSVIAQYAYAIELHKQYQLSNKAQEDRVLLDKAMLHYLASLKIYDKSTDSYMRVGELLAAEFHQPTEALHYYRKAISLDPANPQAHLGAGFSFSLLNQPDSAIHYFRNSLSYDSVSLQALLNLSVIFSQKNQLDSAIYYSQIAIRHYPNSDVVNANMGYYYKAKADSKTARQFFEKAIRINPERTDVINAIKEMSE